MMAPVMGQSRYQSTLFPEVLDEIVSIDDPVLVIDAFVETLGVLNYNLKRVLNILGVPALLQALQPA
jgi:hypothetical protein